jgi:hypothetical protein
MGYSIDIAAIGWWLLGCGSMLLLSLLLLVSFGWRLVGHHVVNVIGEAGRRAVDARLGNPKKTKAKRDTVARWPWNPERESFPQKTSGRRTPPPA